MKSAPQYPLALDRACWQGEPVVAIVAETREQAEEQLKQRGDFKTPDALLPVPLLVRGRVVNWIDSKATFGDPVRSPLMWLLMALDEPQCHELRGLLGCLSVSKETLIALDCP
jgi:hypothetical protein